MPPSKHLSASTITKVSEHLVFLYGEDQLPELLRRIQTIIGSSLPGLQQSTEKHLTQKDVVLITYADQLRRSDEPPLRTLSEFLSSQLNDLISTVHLLPFFPYSSDDGFSVIDYRQVNPDSGDWEDMQGISDHFDLMFDAVINHISAQSSWMEQFLGGNPSYRDFFIAVDPQEDLSSVVRPRDLPLLTPFKTNTGEVYLWTTFSADQIDLNFSNPEVFLEILDLLLYYIQRGARILRLDAIAFLWKEVGTTSIHLPQTHRIIKLWRSILGEIAPHVLLLTETNVPHDENISYFGDGHDEAHMVYQFALPPLILHTLISGDASRLTGWATTLQLPSEQVAFFNFTASHDGIGLRPVQGILSGGELDTLVSLVEERGGGVSYRRLGKNGRQAYELNINYFDALSDPSEIEKLPQRAVDRFLCSQAIMLSFQGLPAIYFHSLFGSRNDLEGATRTGHLRSINREKCELQSFKTELETTGSIRQRVFQGYQNLLHVRREHPAFSPWGTQEVLEIKAGIFALLRTSPEGGRKVLCLHEVSGQSVKLHGTLMELPQNTARDLFTGAALDLSDIRLEPYQVSWIQLD